MRFFIQKIIFKRINNEITRYYISIYARNRPKVLGLKNNFTLEGMPVGVYFRK